MIPGPALAISEILFSCLLIILPGLPAQKARPSPPATPAPTGPLKTKPKPASPSWSPPSMNRSILWVGPARPSAWA